MKIGEWWKKLVYGRRLHVALDSGGRSRPTIVFLHGIAATSRTWLQLEHRLDYATHRVVALDLLGCGGSPQAPDSDYTPDEHCAYIHRTIRSLGIKKPYMLVGHSMGALLSVHYMTMWSSEVSRAVLVGMPLYIKKSANKKFGWTSLQNNFYEQAYAFFRAHPKFTVDGAQFVRKLLRLDDGIDITAQNWRAFSQSLKNTIENQQTYEELQQIAAPITMIYGSRDEFAVKGNVKLVAKQRPNITTKVVAGADHVVNKDMAKMIVEVLRDE